MATILIVEDDHKTNEAICEYLKPAGHTVIPAYDGGEALQLFTQNSIDLVVLDIMLPRVSGLSVLHEIRRTSTTPVLMLTAIGDEYTQVMSFDEQADDYMTKPFSMVLLGKAVRKFMEMKTLTPTILHELVEQIDVYQTQGTGKNRTQRIVIHYNFIGVLDMPEVEEYPDNVVLDSRQGVAVEYLVGKAG